MREVLHKRNLLHFVCRRSGPVAAAATVRVTAVLDYDRLRRRGRIRRRCPRLPVVVVRVGLRTAGTLHQLRDRSPSAFWVARSVGGDRVAHGLDGLCAGDGVAFEVVNGGAECFDHAKL